MNDQLQQALLTVLQSTIDAATAAKNFLVAEVPDVIHQLLVWKAVQSGIGFTLGVLLLGWTLRLVVIIRRLIADPADRSGAIIGWCFVALFAGVVGAIIVACNLDWLQILVAPKIYLIEYAAHLARSMK